MTGSTGIEPAPGEGEPLIDPMVVFSTVWRFRYFIAFLALLGAALGVMLALSTPRYFVATNQFVLDPRELRLTDTDLLQQSYSSESTLALVDSQVAIVDSAPVLQAVVAKLGLADDPEFNGELSNPIGDLMGSLRSLLSTEPGGAAESDHIAIQALSQAVTVFRASRTFIVYVDVKTLDPEKSALIANTIVDVYISKRQQAQSALFQRTTESLNRQLSELRRDVEEAERRVEEYKAEHDLVDAGGSLITDTQLIQLNQQLAEVRAQKLEVQVKADTASQLDVDALLSGAAPEVLESSTIGELRAAYAVAKRSFDAQATSLGPRHPKRIAAQQALSTARGEISNELRRIVEASQIELHRVVQLEQQLTADLAVLKTRQVEFNTNRVRLRELEREAAATSQIYQSLLRKARETSEQQNLDTSNIRIISEATAPLQPSGSSRKFIAAGGLALGLAAGFGLALLVGVYRSLNRTAGRSLNGSDADVVAVTPADIRAAPSASTESVERVVSAPLVRPSMDRPADTDEEKPPAVVEPDHPQQADGRVEREKSDPDVSRPDADQEARDLRREIRELRETVERLYRARESARTASGDKPVRRFPRTDF